MKCRPMRIRYWNIAQIVVIVIAVAAVFVPLKNPAYRQGFFGNVVTAIWQLIASAVVALIVYKRFKTERFKRAMPISWDDPFREMNGISQSLYPPAVGEAADLRIALNTEIRKKLRDALTRADRKGVLYGRFLEIEQVVDIEQCCDAAEVLVVIDNQLPDAQFMKDATRGVTELYIHSSSVLGLTLSQTIAGKLFEARKRWLAMATVVE
jgi:hypothetical protein